MASDSPQSTSLEDGSVSPPGVTAVPTSSSSASSAIDYLSLCSRLKIPLQLKLKLLNDKVEMILQALEYEQEQGRDLEEFFQSTAESTHNQKIMHAFVILDPQRHTPSHLHAYLKEFDSRILGLTGAASAMRQMAQEYRVYFKKVQEDGDYYLVDTSHNMYSEDGGCEMLWVLKDEDEDG